MQRLQIDVLSLGDAINSRHADLQEHFHALRRCRQLSQSLCDQSACSDMLGLLNAELVQLANILVVQLSARGLHDLADKICRWHGFTYKLSRALWATCRQPCQSCPVEPLIETQGAHAACPACPSRTHRPPAPALKHGVHSGSTASGVTCRVEPSQTRGFDASDPASAFSVHAQDLLALGVVTPAPGSVALEFDDIGAAHSTESHIALGLLAQPPCSSPRTTAIMLPASVAARTASPARVVLLQQPLSQPRFTRLRTAFDPASSDFWSLHAYGEADTPFFSYLYDLRQPPSNVVEQVAQQLRTALTHCRGTTATDAVGAATRVEWWAHRRAAGASHQLHFDANELLLRQGREAYRLQHPLLSSVLFLSSTGGPTVVLDQAPCDTLAPRGWSAHPVTGDYLVFPGDRLHGVLPDVLPPGDGAHEGPDAERVTLILAWWGDDLQLSPADNDAFEQYSPPSPLCDDIKGHGGAAKQLERQDHLSPASPAVTLGPCMRYPTVPPRPFEPVPRRHGDAGETAGGIAGTKDGWLPGETAGGTAGRTAGGAAGGTAGGAVGGTAGDAAGGTAGRTAGAALTSSKPLLTPQCQAWGVSTGAGSASHISPGPDHVDDGDRHEADGASSEPLVPLPDSGPPWRDVRLALTLAKWPDGGGDAVSACRTDDCGGGPDGECCRWRAVQEVAPVWEVVPEARDDVVSDGCEVGRPAMDNVIERGGAVGAAQQVDEPVVAVEAAGHVEQGDAVDAAERNRAGAAAEPTGRQATTLECESEGKLAPPERVMLDDAGCHAHGTDGGGRCGAAATLLRVPRTMSCSPRPHLHTTTTATPPVAGPTAERVGLSIAALGMPSAVMTLRQSSLTAEECALPSSEPSVKRRRLSGGPQYGRWSEAHMAPVPILPSVVLPTVGGPVVRSPSLFGPSKDPLSERDAPSEGSSGVSDGEGSSEHSGASSEGGSSSSTGGGSSATSDTAASDALVKTSIMSAAVGSGLTVVHPLRFFLTAADQIQGMYCPL